MAYFEVSVPTFNEIKDQAFPMTDYARESGATINYVAPNNSNKKMLFSECWLRTKSEKSGEMETYRWRSSRAQKASRAADSDWLAVLPRFRKTYMVKMDTTVVNDQTVLRMNDKIPLYPQTAADEFTSMRLDQELTKEKSRLVEVGYYTRPYFLDKKENRLAKTEDTCYQYLDKTYARVRKGEKNAWYVCEPIQVTATPDRGLQCKNMLFSCPFDTMKNFHANNRFLYAGEEVEVGDSTLGNFLNYSFMADLDRSTEFEKAPARKLKKLQDAAFCSRMDFYCPVPNLDPR